MIAYAAQTGNKRTTRMLLAAGWGVMISPASRGKPVEGMRYAIDNGAWSAFVKGTKWDAGAFLKLMEAAASDADFAVVPDIVGGGLSSLERSAQWIPRLRGSCRLLLPVQDGMTQADVEPLLRGGVGIFLGGTTQWKLDTMIAWGSLAASKGLYLHVGRVNTARRLSLCAAAGADSFDGSSVSKFSRTLAELDYARRRGVLFTEKGGSVCN